MPKSTPLVNQRLDQLASSISVLRSDLDTRLSSLSLQHINTSHSLRAIEESLRTLKRQAKAPFAPKIPVRSVPFKANPFEVREFKLSNSEKSEEIPEQSEEMHSPPPKKGEKKSQSPPFSPQTCEKKAKANNIQNIRNFDDFKNLLEDLKFTLNTSNYSNFNDETEKGLRELESELGKYTKLDKDIEAAVDQLTDEQIKAKDELVNLLDESNFPHHQQKLKELKENPSDFEGFLLKLKKELVGRRRSFEDICFRFKIKSEESF